MNFSSDALRDVDWDENLPLPIANAENKLLDEDIQRKLIERNRYTNELTENTAKANALKEHIKYVKDELISAQVNLNFYKYFWKNKNIVFVLIEKNLLRARKHEHKTEEHLKSIAERENGRLIQENQKLVKQIEDLKEKLNSNEVKIFSLFKEKN